jgi:hypothetical protein
MSIDEIEGSAADSAAEEAKGISLLRQAEKRREQQADTLFLEVPTWGGDLIAEYKVIDRTRLDTLVRKMQQQARGGNAGNAATMADINLLLEANVGIYAYDADGGDSEEDCREPIMDDHGTVTYDRIGRVLGKDFRAAREAVLYLMKNNPIAISTHAMNVARWMRDPSKDPMEGQE